MAYNSTVKAQFQSPQGLWIDATIKGTDLASTHFAWYEIWNEKNSTPIKMKMYDNEQYNSWVALDCLEFCRVDCGHALTIALPNGKGGSGWREEKWNKSVGGVSNSLHLFACAFDLQEGAMSDAEFAKWLERVRVACYKYGKNGKPLQAELGRYQWGVHIGFCYKLPYAFNGDVYVFDKR